MAAAVSGAFVAGRRASFLPRNVVLAMPDLPMRRIDLKKRLLRAVAPWLAALLSLPGCGGRPTAPATTPAADAPASKVAEAEVYVVQVALQSWPRTVRVQGSLIEDEYALLGAKVAGRVKNVLIDIGSTVKAGQVIAELETDEFDLRVQQAEAQVAQARASVGLRGNVPDEQLEPTKAPPVQQEQALLDEARLNVQRVKSLVGKGVVTQEEIQSREAALRVAEARYRSSLNAVQEQIALLKLRRSELALAHQNRQDAVLTAPFDGTIQEVRVAPGSYVNIGQPIAALVRTSPLRFRAGVPERSAVGVAVGQTVRMNLEGVAEPIIAQISRISPALDLSSRALIIEADVDNSAHKLRTGLFAEAEILVNEQDQTLAVPATSVTTFGGVEKVWVVADNQARPQLVRLGRRDGDRVEVRQGLEAGQWIMTNGDQGREGVVRAVDSPPARGGDGGSQLGG
jgi:RND family efflux transporter MFP subunit